MLTIDVFYILKWFLAFFVIGAAFLPLTFSLFSNFKDKGYIFSKIIGLGFISYFIFIVGLLKIVKFSEISVLFSLILFYILNYSLYIYYKKQNPLLVIKKNIKIFFIEELIFFIALVFWVFVRGNLPEIKGLEKFMDFGFLNSILRSDYFPPKDMWYAPQPINYYYFGHLMTAVLTKLSFIPSFISYNLMLATLFALTFTASLSLAINIFINAKFSVKSNLSGILTAILLSFGGNLTTIYAFFKPYVPADNPVPLWQLPFLPFSFPNGFWYPNATRFIPFTIHEFPLYSFVVSDLHGHVLDIPFVLLIIASSFSIFISKQITKSNLVFLSFILSIMYMTNAWDGIIYFLLIAFVLFYLIIRQAQVKHQEMKNEKLKIYTWLSSLFIVGVGFIAFSIPFSLNFKPFVSGIGVLCAPSFITNLGKIGPFIFEANHCQQSPIWQLLLLYGFFYFFVLAFIVFLKFKKNYKLSKNDIFVLILITLSSLLLIIPEFIYIKDIYPLHYRANTMFKLSYEAFIMLSICSSYILIKLLSNIKNKLILFIFFLSSLILISLNLIYPFFAIGSYYRNLTNYQGLNGIKYLAALYPDDYKLINWTNNNIKGQPVILEASGDSYTDYARISANTGLPTVIGWSVHEWLWRGTYDVVAPRIEDVKTIYTGNDINLTKILLAKYQISYVVISLLEKEKYPNLNEGNFKKLGKIVYKNNSAVLYKINLAEF
ncbi:MAG: DUF2298 domain-containing protein [Patescibacteria group bacterium]